MKKYIFTTIFVVLAANIFAQNTQSRQQPRTNQQTAPSASANADSGIVVAAIPDQTYTSVAFTPKVVVKDGMKTLVENIDYMLNYSNNVNVGTGTVTILGKGNYADNKTVNFNILPKSINAVQINPVVDQIYRGTPITPDISIKDGTKSLVKEIDYTITYSNNVNVGTASVIITGKGNYKDSKSFVFRINPKSMGGNSRPSAQQQQQAKPTAK
ncbi:MAG: hypothetical protein LBS50_06070 [Prevotellaceae bacterium]|jgi:hypothetical protein|nr:hypothetical protein [Prevotellaceae bacterium]